MSKTGLQNSDFKDDGAHGSGCSGNSVCGLWGKNNLAVATALHQPNLACYRVKTAYNCCALTNFQNTYVNVCALEACISQGYRALDFEVYLVDGKAQIAVSSKSSVHVKTSYNAISCTKAFNVIKNQAFSTKHCPNPGDPLIIILRIKSNHVACHNSIANAIESTIKSNLLSIATYGKECRNAKLPPQSTHGINDVPVSEFMGEQIIVIVDDSANGGKLLPAHPPSDKTEPTNPSKLWQYTHGTVGSDNMQVKLTTLMNLVGHDDIATIIDNARNKMTIVYPEYSPNATSISINGCKPPQDGDSSICDGPIGVKNCGTQLVGTCNQSVMDIIKQGNDTYFKNKERAWVLRDSAFLPKNKTSSAPVLPAANSLFKLSTPLQGPLFPPQS